MRPSRLNQQKSSPFLALEDAPREKEAIHQPIAQPIAQPNVQKSIPPPPPPPPPQKPAPTPASSAPLPSTAGRGNLLASIRAGKSLKKAATNDRSAPKV